MFPWYLQFSRRDLWIKVISENIFCFCRQIFFSQVDCSILSCLTKKERERERKTYRNTFYSASVCELEVLRNEFRSSQLSSPHSVLLLIWSVFFCYFILSTLWWLSLGVFTFFFPGVNFENEKHVSKTSHRNAAMNICLQTAQPVGKDSTVTHEN